jgi:thiamine kinase-like enzyme
MKESQFDVFSDIVKNIINLRYSDENATSNKFFRSISVFSKRVIRTLRKRNYDPIFTKKIEALFDDGFSSIMMECVKPIEPLATIIHGDCTINNILFRMHGNEETESLEAMLVDFALIMYSSPALDIVTFIYMCCPRMYLKENFEYVKRIATMQFQLLIIYK